MCNIWKHPSKVKDELTLGQIEKIFTDLRDFGVRQVLLQGGEPLLRKDIFEIIDLMIKLGVKPALVTNGMLLNKKTALRLSRLKCNVSFSLDTLKPSRYRKIRGVDAFKLVKDNILFASRIKRKKGSWFINSTFSEINYDECLEIYDFATSNGFRFSAWPYNYSICKASAKDDELVFKNKDKIINAFSKLVDRTSEAGDKVNELIFSEAVDYLKGDYCLPCDALRYSFMVDEYGRASPCLELSHEFSLKKKSIREVWPKFNRERVKQCYSNNPCFYGCTRASGVLSRNWSSLVKYGLSNISQAKKLLRTIY